MPSIDGHMDDVGWPQRGNIEREETFSAADEEGVHNRKPSLMQQINSPEDRTIVTTTEARAGRIVKGGAMRRLLVVSLILAVAALFVSYLIVSYGS